MSEPTESTRPPEPRLVPVQPTRSHAGCGCGHADGPLTLDARPIPRRLRHAAVIGAVSSLGVGEGFDLLAPHVPTPLLAQIDQLPPTFEHSVLEVGESLARVHIRRTA